MLLYKITMNENQRFVCSFDSIITDFNHKIYAIPGFGGPLVAFFTVPSFDLANG